MQGSGAESEKAMDGEEPESEKAMLSEKSESEKAMQGDPGSEKAMQGEGAESEAAVHGEDEVEKAMQADGGVSHPRARAPGGAQRLPPWLLAMSRAGVVARVPPETGKFLMGLAGRRKAHRISGCPHRVACLRLGVRGLL